MYMEIDMRPRADMSLGLNMSLRSDLYVIGLNMGLRLDI